MPIYCLRIRSFEPPAYYRGSEECKINDLFIVNTETGPAMGRLISGPLDPLPGLAETDLPEILRLATSEDLAIQQENFQLARQAKTFCKDCIYKRNLDMKLVNVEVFFDRSKFIFYFTAPNRIDFRELVKDLVKEYRARIELRQIGVRHETQMLGAIGNCGMVCCCRRHLRKFAPVTIKMAKEQNLFLNPAKISGICGRLLCCLSYEQDNYDNFHNISPRAGKKYATSKGVLKVLRTNMFKNSVTVLWENNEEKEMGIDEWQTLNPKKTGGDNYAQEEEKNAFDYPEEE